MRAGATINVARQLILNYVSILRSNAANIARRLILNFVPDNYIPLVKSHRRPSHPHN